MVDRLFITLHLLGVYPSPTFSPGSDPKQLTVVMPIERCEAFSGH